MSILLMTSTRKFVEAAAKPVLARKTATIAVGEKAKIKIKNVPQRAKITYKSSRKNIASVSKKGQVKGLKSGVSKIKVTIKKNFKTTKLIYKVIVKKPKLSTNKLFLLSGTTAKLSVKNKPKTAKYVWKSSNSKIAKVNTTLQLFYKHKKRTKNFVMYNKFPTTKIQRKKMSLYVILIIQRKNCHWKTASLFCALF